MAKKRQPKRAWEQPYDSDYWEFSPVRGYTLVVTTDDLGLYPGGRWYWFIQKPGGWEVSSSRGFRSSRQAKLAAEDHMIGILEEHRSPTANPAMTYAQAREHLLNALELQHWDVRRRGRDGKSLKVPYATKGRSRVYFKSQSMHVACGPPFSLNDARSTHDDPRELAELIGDDWRMWDKMSRSLEGRCLRANPIKGMPGGSVSGCIEEMEEQGDIDDPAAYCAAIADRIEPGWRDENPGFAAGVLTGAAAGVAIPYLVGRSKLKLTIAEPTYFVWRKGSHAIDARLYEGYWRFQVTQDGKATAKREFPFSADYVDSVDLAWVDGLEWATEQIGKPRKGNPKKAQVSAISRRLRIR